MQEGARLAYITIPGADTRRFVTRIHPRITGCTVEIMQAEGSRTDITDALEGNNIIYCERAGTDTTPYRVVFMLGRDVEAAIAFVEELYLTTMDIDFPVYTYADSGRRPLLDILATAAENDLTARTLFVRNPDDLTGKLDTTGWKKLEDILLTQAHGPADSDDTPLYRQLERGPNFLKLEVLGKLTTVMLRIAQCYP